MIAEHLQIRALNIADIHDGDLAVALGKERNKARAERIAEDDQLLFRRRVRIFNRHHGKIARKEHLVRILSDRLLHIVKADLFAVLMIVDRAIRHEIAHQITDLLRLQRKRTLSVIHTVKRMV